MKNFKFDNQQRNDCLQDKIQIRKTTFVLMVLSFIILNFFIASFLNIQWKLKETKSTYFFTADFKRDIPNSEKEKTEIEILKLDGVKKVRYISKEEAFQKLQYQLDIAIPKSENPLSDSMIIYFKNPSDVEGIQTNLENNQNIKEVFVDGAYIAHLDREQRFLKIISMGIAGFCVLPMAVIIYLIYYSAISIDYINNVGIIQNDKKNRERAKKVNLLPLIASSVIGTLIFFNIYIYFRNHLLAISSNYLILSLKEIILIQILVLIGINILILLKSKQIKVLRRENS